MEENSKPLPTNTDSYKAETNVPQLQQWGEAVSSRFTQPKKYSRAAFLPTYTWDRIKSGSVGKH